MLQLALVTTSPSLPGPTLFFINSVRKTSSSFSSWLMHGGFCTIGKKANAPGLSRFDSAVGPINEYLAIDRMLPGEAELVSEWTGLPGSANIVKRFERSNGPDIALYKNYLFCNENINTQTCCTFVDRIPVLSGVRRVRCWSLWLLFSILPFSVRVLDQLGVLSDHFAICPCISG